jgi:hypothetical protein
MRRTVRRAGVLAGLTLAGVAMPGRAQVVPWLEPSAAAEPAPARATARAQARADRAGPAESTAKPATRDPRRDRRLRQLAAAAIPEETIGIDSRTGPDLFLALVDPTPIVVSHFGGGSGDGAARTGTTWVGQTTQHAGTLSVGGTARDDNGWGATRLSLDASGMSYLNITAQRDAGHAAPTVFIQFEDLSLRTKIVSVSTSQFAVGTLTLVQVPLTGWTIDFGPSQIVSWSLGGGSVGTTDFRMTFDSLALTATAIPEPATTALAVAGAMLAAALGRRRQRRRRGAQAARA